MSNARNLARLLPNASGQLPDAAMASGSVLQVVTVSTSTAFNTSSATYADLTGLSASITPLSNTSRIVAIVSGDSAASRNGSGTTWGGCLLRVMRDATQVTEVQHGVNFGVSTWADFFPNTSLITVDSPASTAQLTYKVQVAATGGVLYNAVAHKASLTLMEIAG